MSNPLVEKKEGRDSIPGRDLKNEATTTYLLLTIHLLREVILTPLSLEIEITWACESKPPVPVSPFFVGHDHADKRARQHPLPRHERVLTSENSKGH